MSLYRVYIFDENDMHPGPVDYTGPKAELKSILHALKNLNAPHTMVCDGLDMAVYESKHGLIVWPENLAKVQGVGKINEAIKTLETMVANGS